MVQKSETEVNEESVGLVCKINDLIYSGVKCDDGKLREFDFLDYLDHTLMPLKNFNRLCDMILKGTETMKIKKFITKNYEIKLLEDEDIYFLLKEKYEVNCKKDKYGYPISGTGRLITTQEKVLLIKYLRGLTISITDRAYNAAMKRYVDGNLDLDLENCKNLSK